MLILDFETRSRASLKDVGVDNYALDPSTEVLCCAFTDLDTCYKWLWFPHDGPLPHHVVSRINDADELAAHNARFDQLIWEAVAVPDHNFPAVPRETWYCTSAQCRVSALPSGLDDATRAMDTRHRKNHIGNALIRKLSTPNKKTGEFTEDAELLRQMGAYCLDDVLATKAVVLATARMDATEKLDWQVSERINDRGVKIDRELAELAIQYADREKLAIGARLNEITEGAVTAHTQTKRVLDWLIEPLELHEYPAAIKKDGRLTLDKAARAELLASNDLDDDERAVIELVDQGGKSSVAKFQRMIDRADPETDRVHGAFVYAGAGQTKRYASRGLQLHNLGRDCFSAEETESLLVTMRRGENIPTPVMHTLAKLLRPAITPDSGYTFVVGDWSAIEARVLPWLANSEGGEKVLNVFREGRDIYAETATGMNIPDRQIGKVAVLSLGFGGAVGAFSAMAKNYGLELPESRTKAVVRKWRVANLWAGEFWGQLERAAKKAVRNPCTEVRVGRVKYVFVSSGRYGTLFCILPDGSTIQYPQCRFASGDLRAMKASVKPRADSTGEWPTMSLWGGFLAENITQATAASLLRATLVKCHEQNLPVVGHVHDEVILEVPTSTAGESAKLLQNIMEAAPDWAKGLPLEAKPELMTRYGK